MDSSSFADAFQELNQRFIRLVDDLSALRILADIDLKGLREEEVLQTAVRALLALGEFERCSVFVPREERLVRVARGTWKDLSSGVQQTAGDDGAHPAGEDPVSRAARTRRLQHGPSRTGAASLCAPIVQGDELLGVLEVSTASAGDLRPRHEQLLTIFASFLAQTLLGWRYFHRLDEETTLRKERLVHALHQAEALERRYRQLAVIDELTGIHNRRFFFPEATAALAGALRHRSGFSVLLMDLDHFREINERLGRSAGDEILRITAALLEGQKRECDILARFGGDEFAFALPHTDTDGARHLGDRILQTLRALSFRHGGEKQPVRASIGIAALPPSAAEDRHGLLETLLRQADQALHVGKTQGRDRVLAFGEPLAAG